jgi:hypothetical protein
MRKLIWIVICNLFLFSPFIVKCQPLIIDWQQCYIPRDDNLGMSFVKLSDGYAILCEVAYDEDDYDICLLRTDTLGNIIWSKTYGGMEEDDAIKIKITMDDGFILAGTTYSWDIPGNHGSFDFLMIKTDSSGNIEWEKCYGGLHYDVLEDMDVTKDSGYICVGETASDDGEVTGYHGSWDIWVVRLDKYGNIKWEQCYGGSEVDWPMSVAVTFDNGSIIGGNTNSIDGDVHHNHHGGDAYSEAWIIKVDSAGIIQWEKCYGGSLSDGFTTILPISDTNYLCGGVTKSNDGQVTGNHGYGDFWVLKIDHLGNLLWQKCYGGGLIDGLSCLKSCSSDTYIVGGYTLSYDGDVSGNHSIPGIAPDMWLIKISEEGDLIWQRCFGADGEEVMYDLLVVNPGKYLLLGYSRQSQDVGDVYCNDGTLGKTKAWFLSVTDTSYTGIIVSDKKDGSVTVFPVPADQFVKFDLTNHETGTDKMIFILDGIGRIVERINVRKTERYVTWNTLNCRPGLYYYQITGINSTETGKIIIMK